METKWKDVAHLYIGCKVLISSEQYKGTGLRFIGIDELKVAKVIDDGIKLSFYVNLEETKPILRRLDDMTEEEFKEFKKITDDDFSKKVAVPAVTIMETTLVHKMDHVLFLLSKSFDLFNLIPTSQAIDAKQVK